MNIHMDPRQSPFLLPLLTLLLASCVTSSSQTTPSMNALEAAGGLLGIDLLVFGME
ncbi:MAG: hypothetical protein QF752_17450 [Planctomycetota bacterium]|nr:hypothetical protein [Planctomycetota bacterium]